MGSDEPWTIGRLLTWTTSYLKQRGSDSAQLDAQVLLAHARQCRRIDLYTAYGETPPEEVLAAFRELVRLRAAGTPVAYLVGHREFYSLPFRVTRDVLIPRPETEYLVVALLDLIKERGDGQAPLEIADVGPGSGVLAVCAAAKVPRARVWATDVSEPALAVAAANCQDHGVADRVQLLLGDLLQPVPADVRFDYVLSNPPYVSETEYTQLAVDIRGHEPRQALVAGPTGLEIIARLVPAAAERLRPGGGLLVEISPMIEPAVRRIVQDHGQFPSYAVIPDLAGQPRVVRAITGS
jgi:release factor glutamine methyltransferase